MEKGMEINSICKKMEGEFQISINGLQVGAEELNKAAQEL